MKQLELFELDDYANAIWCDIRAPIDPLCPERQVNVIRKHLDRLVQRYADQIKEIEKAKRNIKKELQVSRSRSTIIDKRQRTTAKENNELKEQVHDLQNQIFSLRQKLESQQLNKKENTHARKTTR